MITADALLGTEPFPPLNSLLSLVFIVDNFFKKVARKH